VMLYFAESEFESLHIDREFILEYCRNRQEVCIDFLCPLFPSKDLDWLYEEMRGGNREWRSFSVAVIENVFDKFLSEKAGLTFDLASDEGPQFVSHANDVNVYECREEEDDIIFVCMFEGLIEINFSVRMEIEDLDGNSSDYEDESEDGHKIPYFSVGFVRYINRDEVEKMRASLTILRT
ncbi:hypothetical protein PFISCL1PPCAC_19201, partial [Pristionchus fissidentatus]